MKTEEILESITGGFFALDENLIITYWNKSAEEGTGYKRKEVLGKIFLKFSQMRKMLKSVGAILWQCSRKMQSFSSSYADDRHEAWYSIKFIQTKMGFLFFKDATEEKRHEKQRDILLEASQLINSSIKIDTLTLK